MVKATRRPITTSNILIFNINTDEYTIVKNELIGAAVLSYLFE